MARRRPRVRPASRARSRGGTSAGRWVAWLSVLALAGGLGWVCWQAFRDASWLEAASEVPDLPGAAELNLPSPPEWDADPRGGGLSEATPPATSSVPVAPSVPAPVPGGSGPAGTGTVAVPNPAPTPAPTPTPTPTPAPGGGPGEERTRLSGSRVVAMQLALARRGISSGPVDGVLGTQTQAALREFQRREGLPASGQPDPATLRRLEPDEAGAYASTVVTADDLRRLAPVPESWLGKASRERLDYESALELVAERAHAHPRLIRQMNPQIDWNRVAPGTVVRVPATALPAPKSKAALVRISLSEKALRVFDARSNLLAHFPCSIARKVEKRPVGRLQVARLAPNPNYRFDPQIFRESEEARRIGRRLMIPPGPNNPVGTAWIGLDRPGYGIHGTPQPEAVGRTESHGCFRLANWNAEYLLKLAWVGMPVYVEP